MFNNHGTHSTVYAALHVTFSLGATAFRCLPLHLNIINKGGRDKDVEAKARVAMAKRDHKTIVLFGQQPPTLGAQYQQRNQGEVRDCEYIQIPEQLEHSCGF